MTKVTATEKRFDGMRKVYEAFPNEKVTEANRTELCEMIRNLKSLGRTERWTGSVEAWASAIENQDTEKGMLWAYLQWGVYANYAAL